VSKQSAQDRQVTEIVSRRDRRSSLAGWLHTWIIYRPKAVTQKTRQVISVQTRQMLSKYQPNFIVDRIQQVWMTDPSPLLVIRLHLRDSELKLLEFHQLPTKHSFRRRL